MSDGLMKAVQIIFIIQIFYSFAITSFVYALPDDTLDYVNSFSDIANDLNMETVTAEAQDTLDSSLDIPVIELGALVFYSGNILIDFLVNFAFAVPQMLGLLINGFTFMFNFDYQLANIMELFFIAVVLVLYVVGLLQLLMNVRSGRVI